MAEETDMTSNFEVVAITDKSITVKFRRFPPRDSKSRQRDGKGQLLIGSSGGHQEIPLSKPLTHKGKEVVLKINATIGYNPD